MNLIRSGPGSAFISSSWRLVYSLWIEVTNWFLNRLDLNFVSVESSFFSNVCHPIDRFICDFLFHPPLTSCQVEFWLFSCFFFLIGIIAGCSDEVDRWFSIFHVLFFFLSIFSAKILVLLVPLVLVLLVDLFCCFRCYSVQVVLIKYDMASRLNWLRIDHVSLANKSLYANKRHGLTSIRTFISTILALPSIITSPGGKGQ